MLQSYFGQPSLFSEFRADPFFRDFLQENSLATSPLDQMLGFGVGGTEPAVGMHWRPKSDIIEKDDHFVIYCDLPGVTKELIDLHVDFNSITLTCNKPKVTEEDKNYLLKQRRTGLFRRKWDLPANADCSRLGNTNIHFENGVITIRVPKSISPTHRKLCIL